jgi:hypothetical protein
MLLSWAESSSRGRTVTFMLPEDEETHPFKDFSMKQGKRAGQRFMAVLVQIGDDEQVVPQQRPSQIAALLCKDPLFWRWATERSFDTIDSEDGARNYLCSGAGIDSRKKFDTNRAAFDWLMHMVVTPFNTYRTTVNTKLMKG